MCILDPINYFSLCLGVLNFFFLRYLFNNHFRDKPSRISLNSLILAEVLKFGSKFIFKVLKPYKSQLLSRQASILDFFPEESVF